MAGYDGRGAKFPLTIVRGADMAFTVTATDSDAAAIDLSAATIAGEVYDGDGTLVDTFTHAVSGTPTANVITLSFTDTETTALTSDAYTWTLWVTRGGDKRPWLAGPVRLTTSTNGGPGSSGTAVTATVDSNVNVSVSIASVGAAGSIDSVNGQTGVVVLDADDIDDAATTNKFATAAQLAAVDGLAAAYQPLATVLTNTTASYTTAEASKLAGIEAGATADQSASEILTAIKTVDGTGSGLDADTVDGVEASALLTTATAASTYQPLDADLTDIAAIADAQGDIIVRGASGWERLAKSATSTDVLTAGASQPTWAAAAGGGDSVPVGGVVRIETWDVADATLGTWSLSSAANYIGNAVYFTTSGSGSYSEWNRYLTAGTYALDYLYLKNTDSAIVDISIDGVVVSSLDHYNGSTVLNSRLTVTGIVVGTSGTKALRVASNGKNASSSGHAVRAYLIALRRTA